MDLSELKLNCNDDLLKDIREIYIDSRKEIRKLENITEKRLEILTSAKGSPSLSPRTSQLSDTNPHFDNNTTIELNNFYDRNLDCIQMHEGNEFHKNKHSKENPFLNQFSNNLNQVANNNSKDSYSLPTVTKGWSVNTTNASSPALLTPEFKEKSVEENSVELLRVNIPYSGLSDISGLEDVKQGLREAIIYPMKYPHLFNSGRQIWSRALLYGPPGVGKTALVQAVSAEANLPLYQVSSADLFSVWFGQTEKQIREMFSQLGLQRCILFMDEIDSLCRKRTSGDGEHSRRMQTELMIQMENYESSSMFLICATNCPWDIDPAFLRRFQQRIYVPLPDYDARESVLLSCLSLGRLPTLWSGWAELIDKTSGLTGADIKNIVRMASMVPLREMQKAMFWKMTPDGKCIPCGREANNSFQCKLEEIPPAKVRLTVGNGISIKKAAI